MPLVSGVFSGQGEVPRPEVVLPHWELCFVRREEAEGPGRDPRGVLGGGLFGVYVGGSLDHLISSFSCSG